MTNELALVLAHFNLSSKEATLYLAALKTGPATAYQLAKETGLKQPTAYVLARELVGKGFLTLETVRNRQHFVPVAPRLIVRAWKGKIESLEAITPELNAFYERSTGAPRALVYEGMDGIERAYLEMLAPRGTGKDEMLLVSNTAAFADPYGHLFPMWQRCARDKRNRIRDLVLDQSEGQEYAKIMRGLENPNYEVRLHKGSPFGRTDILIYSSKISFFSFGEHPFATVLESRELSQTLHVLFEATWKNAKVIA